MFKTRGVSKYFLDEEHYTVFGKKYKSEQNFKGDIVNFFLPQINSIFENYKIIFNSKFSKMNSHITFSCDCKDHKSIIITIYLDLDNQPTYIYIDYLVSCKVNSDEIKGGDILTKIIQLKDEIGVEFIQLRDVSFKVVKNCRLNLAIFKIITSTDGFSWYNKYGFFSIHHDDDITTNMTNRSMTFSKLINEKINPVHQVKLLNLMNKHGIDGRYTIRSYFLSVQNMLNDPTYTVDCDFIYDLNDLLELLVSSGIIQYDNVLYYKNGTYLTRSDIDDIELFFV